MKIRFWNSFVCCLCFGTAAIIVSGHFSVGVLVFVGLGSFFMAIDKNGNTEKDNGDDNGQ